METSQISIIKPNTFSFREILWFLDRNYDDCLFEVDQDSVRRLIKKDGLESLIEIKEAEDHLMIESLIGDTMPLNMVEDYVTSWFDMYRNIQPFYDLLERSNLSYMAEDYGGLRLVGIPDLFEALCWCIIGQQINLNFAYTIKRRFVETFGTGLEYADRQYYSFPTPEILKEVTMEELKSMQFSRQKADYILNLAKFFRENPSFQQQLNKLPVEDQYKRLVGLRGVGEWTANYVLMKTFGRTDSVPHGDSGLFKAMENHGVISDRKDRNTIDRFFAQFPGWGSYLTIYLWRSLNSPG